ncbi:hypothetical protein Tco_0018832 [Tanacetum coccineum]
MHTLKAGPDNQPLGGHHLEDAERKKGIDRNPHQYPSLVNEAAAAKHCPVSGKKVEEYEESGDEEMEDLDEDKEMNDGDGHDE